MSTFLTGIQINVLDGVVAWEREIIQILQAILTTTIPNEQNWVWNGNLLFMSLVLVLSWAQVSWTVWVFKLKDTVHMFHEE